MVSSPEDFPVPPTAFGSFLVEVVVFVVGVGVGVRDLVVGLEEGRPVDLLVVLMGNSVSCVVVPRVGVDGVGGPGVGGAGVGGDTVAGVTFLVVPAGGAVVVVVVVVVVVGTPGKQQQVTM